MFAHLSRIVARASGRKIPVIKPIVGKGAFLHESGVHTRALLVNSQSYQPFRPEMVGMKAKNFVVGKHSGKAGLEHFFEREGIHISRSDCLKVLCKIKEACKKKKSLSLQEIRQIYMERFRTKANVSA